MQPLPLDTEGSEMMRTAKKPMPCVGKTAHFHRLIAAPQARCCQSAYIGRRGAFRETLL